jgi:Holliday junction resolvase RusA-like endonuclease
MDFQPGAKCQCCAACEAYKPGGRAVENVAGSGRWRQLVAYACTQEMRSVTQAWPLDGPVVAAGVFWLPVKDVTTKGCGDLDKLVRNVLDALQDAGVYGDDVQVTRVLFDKAPATPERGPGLDLRILVP